MKNTYRLTWLLSLFVILFSSCNEDDIPVREESYIPGSDAVQAYFPSDSKSDLAVSPTDNSVTIKLMRTNTEKAITVSLSSFDANNVFTIPSTAEFAAGEAEAEITIPFEGLTVFTAYTAEITIDEQFTDPYKNNIEGGTSNYLLTVTQSDWTDYANGTFTSEFFGDQWEQKLQYSEILEKYRFPNVYGDGYHYEFTWDGGATFTPSGTQDNDGLYVQESGYVHASYGMVSTRTDAAGSLYNQDSQLFNFIMNFTVSAGSFGVNTESYKITEVY